MTAPPDDFFSRVVLPRTQAIVDSQILPALTPLYNEAGGAQHPKLVGSGVVVRGTRAAVLLTTAHVVDDLGTGPAYFGCGGVVVSLPRQRYTSPLPTSGMRDDDLVDLACFVLEPEHLAALGPTDALWPHQLELAPPTSDAYDALLVGGFPATRQPRRLSEVIAPDGTRELDYRAIPLQLLSEEHPRAAYEARGLDPRTHLLVRYNPKDFWRGDAPTIGPNLPGVSGGGVWRLPGFYRMPAIEPRLVGIVTDWLRGADLKGVRATRLMPWLIALRDVDSALFAAIFGDSGSSAD